MFKFFDLTITNYKFYDRLFSFTKNNYSFKNPANYLSNCHKESSIIKFNLKHRSVELKNVSLFTKCLTIIEFLFGITHFKLNVL